MKHLYLWSALLLLGSGCGGRANLGGGASDSGVSAETGHHLDAASRAEASGCRNFGCRACETNQDCQTDDSQPDGAVCGFRAGVGVQGAGCGGEGVCYAPPLGSFSQMAACGCDGTTVTVEQNPSGYLLAPVAYLGECLSCPGAMDAGGVGSPCTSTSECNSGEACAWQIGEGCTTYPGTCVAQVEGCHCVPPPACGCDGEQAITGCSAQLPFGYSLSPYAHAGACVGDAGRSCVSGFVLNDAGVCTRVVDAGSDGGNPCPPGAFLMGGYCARACNSGYECHCGDGSEPIASCPVDPGMACAVLCQGHGGAVAPDAG